MLSKKSCKTKARSCRTALGFSNNERFVLKSVLPERFEYQEKMYEDLRSCGYVRLPVDTIPDQSMFAYRYFKQDLLNYPRNMGMPKTQEKRILRDALRGLVAMHEKRIVHGDVKPGNIVIDYEEEEGEGTDRKITVSRVQLADIEESKYVGKGYALDNWEAGNWLWRSPEAHAACQVSWRSDIFSFGLVCIYALSGHVLMMGAEEEMFHGRTCSGRKDVGVQELPVIMERQISYFLFNAPDDLHGLAQWLRYNPWLGVVKEVIPKFGPENPRKPLTGWTASWMDEDSRDLLVKMTNLNPMKRITAKEALEHRWWKDVPDN